MRRFAVLVLLVFGANAAVGAELPAAHRILIVGDSTASTYPQSRHPRTGWGQVLDGFFDARIEVLNRAISGRSTRSFIAQGHLDRVVSEMKRGDLLLIQFGHNDAKKDDPERYADPDVDFPAGLKRFVAAARSKGATPVLITPVARRRFDESGHALDAHGEYAEAVRRVARNESVDLIELGQRSIDWIEALGPEASKAQYLHDERRGLADDTHFHRRGATAVACMVAGDLTRLRLVDSARLTRDVHCGVPADQRQRQLDQKHPSQIAHGDAIAVPQLPPHGGGGLTIASPFFAGEADLSLIVRRRVLLDGASIGLHDHGQDEVYYVLEGEGEFTLDGVAHAVTKGHALLTRDGSAHSLRQVGSEPLQILIIYNKPIAPSH